MTARTLPLLGGLVTPVSELYALQEIDLSIDSNRTAHAEAEAQLAEAEELNTARELVASEQEALRAAERHFKECEYESDELRRKIEPLEKKLYQGTVHNPKELDDLQRDIESLRRRRSELDDRALVAMEGLEAAQQSCAAAQAELRELEAGRERDVQEARNRMGELDAELAVLQGKRDEQVATIGAKELQLYDRLAAIRQKRPVSKVVGGACQGCRISLPMNLIQRARAGGDMVQCSSCERILFVT